MHKIGQSGGFLGILLGPLLKFGLLLKKAKSALISLGLTVAASATDAAIYKKMFGSGTTTLLISNEEINDMFNKRCCETIKNKAKEQKGIFLSMLLGTLSSSLLGNLLTGKGVKRSKLPGQGVMRAGKETIKAGQEF